MGVLIFKTNCALHIPQSNLRSSDSYFIIIGPLGFTHVHIALNSKNSNLIQALSISYLLLNACRKEVAQTLFTKYKTLLMTAYYGQCFSFRKYLKVKGLGYFLKYISGTGKETNEAYNHILSLEFGTSSPEYAEIPACIDFTVKPRKRKYLYKFNGTDRVTLNSFTKTLQTQAKPDLYKIKGLRFLTEFLKIRPGKKKK
jgi:ribosomal protein L6P/L9E